MLNVVKIKNQLIKAIEISPTVINLKRVMLIPDGQAGFTEDVDIDVVTFRGLINNSNSKRNSVSSGSQSASDGGFKDTISQINLICPYENTFTIEPGDYFVVDGVKYLVQHSIKMYDILWSCTLEVIL